MFSDMMKTLTFAAVAGLSLNGAALADEAGEVDYITYCASCHGLSGVGDDDVAGLLTVPVPVPDLTSLASRNDGEFPFLKVAHIVDGRTGLRAHGTAMPIWGSYFMGVDNGMAGGYSAVYEARGRVLSMVYYLESIHK